MINFRINYYFYKNNIEKYMIASQGHIKKFNLLHLEEGESYIKEFHADIRQFDIANRVHTTK